MPDPRPLPEVRRLWLVLSLLLAAAALLGAIGLGFEPWPLAWPLRAAPSAVGLVLLGALLRSTPRAAWWVLAGPLLAGLAGLASCVVSALSQPELRGLQLGLHLLTGAGLLGAFGAWAGARGPRPRSKRSDPPVLLLEAKERGPKKLPATEVVAGQRVELLGRDGSVPLDGRILEGAGEVALEPLFGGAAPTSKGPGDVLLAGARTEQPFVLEVEAAPGHTLRDRRDALERRLVELARGVGWAERSLFTVVAVLFAGAVALSVWLHPDRSGLERLWTLGSLALVAAGFAPALALRRSRVAALRLFLRRGVYLADLGALRALLGRRRRLFVTPELAAGAGEVEVVSLSDASPAELLSVAAALFADDDGPVAESLRAAQRRQGLTALRSAALRRTQAVLHGTVAGARWFVGPALAVEEEERAALPGGERPFYDSLTARFPIVLVLGRSDRGLVGVLGVSIGKSEVWASVGEQLGAALAPGQPDVVREALAKASGLDARARPLRARDVVVTRFRDLPPSDGVVLRVAAERDLLGQELGTLSLLAEPAAAALPETIARARGVAAAGRVRAGLALLGVALASGAVVWVPALPPLVAAGAGLLLLSLAAGVPARS